MMGDHRSGEGEAENAGQSPDMGRRALLKKVGWAVPVILAVGIPRNAFASVYVSQAKAKGGTIKTV